MTLVKAGSGAVGGAILGMALWVAVGYFTHYEVSIVAIALGAAAGFGAMTLAGASKADSTTGAVAAIVAVLGVLGAKYTLACINVHQNIGSILPHHVMTDDDVKNTMADDIIEERQAAGKPVEWRLSGSAVDSDDEPTWPNEYPQDVVAEAEKKWTALPTTEQESKRAEQQAAWDKMEREFPTRVVPQLRWIAFKSSLDGFDVIWSLLAIVAAYRLGSGTTDD